MSSTGSLTIKGGTRAPRMLARPVRGIGPLLNDRYECLETPGPGGEARVVKALDRRHGRYVALKIRPSRDGHAREELLGEARILPAISPHPALPLVREDFFESGSYVVALDWVDGSTWPPARRPRTPAQAREPERALPLRERAGDPADSLVPRQRKRHSARPGPIRCIWHDVAAHELPIGPRSTIIAIAMRRGCRISPAPPPASERDAIWAVLRPSGRAPRQISRRETDHFEPPPIYATASGESESEASGPPGDEFGRARRSEESCSESSTPNFRRATTQVRGRAW